VEAASSGGSLLRAWRERAGLSQEALAERVGLNVTTLTALEHDQRRRPHPHTLATLAEALGLTPAERTTLLDAARVGGPRGSAEWKAPAAGERDDDWPIAFDRRSNLPPARVVLYGRGAEIERLADGVFSSPGRLVTLTGSGGVGKTSVALAVARQVQADLPHGAWFVDLSTLTVSGAVSRAVARAVGVRESYAATIDEALRAFLHDRQLLLVMDNCEHVVDACATLLDDLLDQAPGLRVLATSREPLRIQGEVTYSLPPLVVPVQTADYDADRLSEFASVQLFLDRARAVRPDLQLTDRSAEAVAEICRRLEGIPLALELAATRVGGLTLEHIARRLRDSFAVLISGGRSRPARHQTLRATLQWSFALLSPVEQAVFARLGAFASGWTVAAAEAVCAGDDIGQGEVADVVAGLVDRSLVVLDNRADEGEARYRFLEPVRDYAQGRLAASAESKATRDRHCAYYVAFAEQAEPEIHRAQQAAWMRRLDSELDNLRLAVRTGQARSDSDSVLRLTGALWWYLWVRGHLREGLDWLDGLLDASDVPDRARMAGLRVSTMLLGSLGRSGEAMARAAELVGLAERTGDVAEAARAATLLGLEEFRAAHLERAQPLLERALDDARAVDHPMLVPHALVNLGAILFERGQPDQAEVLYREGLARFERNSDVWGIAYATNYLAGLVRQRGDHPQAARLSAEAVRLLLSLGDRFYLLLAVEDLARARLEGRHDHSAARLLGAAHALRLASGAILSPFSQAENARDMMRLRAALGDAGFERAWANAADHPLEVLAHEVMAPAQPTPLPAVDGLGGPGGVLTAREMEIVRLIGRGYSNKQIAEELVMTVGTAGVHVEHILRKLDLRSRHQVADWAKSQGLLSN
jgi:predicted ATPase/DNA-binding CsgD family transcriptional regulator/transcriptional regulator with XRE-family HTH domain